MWPLGYLPKREKGSPLVPLYHAKRRFRVGRRCFAWGNVAGGVCGWNLPSPYISSWFSDMASIRYLLVITPEMAGIGYAVFPLGVHCCLRKHSWKPFGWRRERLASSCRVSDTFKCIQCYSLPTSQDNMVINSQNALQFLLFSIYICAGRQNRDAHQSKR